MRPPTFPPRVRFNWGFWDARQERTLGRRRALVDHGPQSTRVVSRQHDRYYHAGYAAGLQSQPDDTVTSSAPFWRAWRAS